ncbi:hypothetical protein NC653_012431 [Populus alba x Populus x berolinensis]|uniref:Uncharacterized protein n=1 Tax=Populus alba x Populus x berolinensis TaxID=444605 RepID=A0AAD6R565_9ROSI|nr:hypothetical protein NC653_012431 [Populus alba x Populus x berolinensis]
MKFQCSSFTCGSSLLAQKTGLLDIKANTAVNNGRYLDDWLLRQIYWLRSEETIAFGIRWVQDSGAPATLVSLIGNKQYKRLCKRTFSISLSSTICVKQLAYGILELLIISVFPELRIFCWVSTREMRAPPA